MRTHAWWFSSSFSVPVPISVSIPIPIPVPISSLSFSAFIGFTFTFMFRTSFEETRFQKVMSKFRFVEANTTDPTNVNLFNSYAF